MSESFSEEPPRNKKKKPSMSPSFSLSSLPDEVALSCMALLSRSDHASLSRVSKRYRSLVASPELYKIRSQLGYSCFYVCLSIHGPYSTPRWFIISREKTVNRLMTPIPPCPSSHPLKGFSVVSLDCGIYVIGGSITRKREYFRSSDPPSSSVLLLDCRTHTWRQVPSMKVARCEAAAGVVDGKIYVFGGCGHNETYGEVFDPKTQTWTTLPSVPDSVKEYVPFKKTMVMGEKIYPVPFWNSPNLLYYSPNEGIWGRRMKDVDVSKIGTKSYCFSMAENVLYSCDDYGNMYWSEPEDSDWNKVEGLGALHNHFYKPLASFIWDTSPCDELLRTFGTNILIFWFKYNPKNTKVDIWCAEISFERLHDKGEIIGKIEWLQSVAGVKGHSSSHLEVLHSAYVNV
ncbi:hypothetical protein IGI04_000091 [Brassica rapa subsp. trilocularis]|uniref:F-box domain-containing protein n=1 Tax=Brassica rapa subsp. trilocularis TaxID=1813537 RepID=A0ABQ7NNV3_BRACM|nr:hypothetical protein IGI04_000091 [Brassica rapa subsp. trilocularis]